ncbi:PhnE/PtxC family ABC transporter permease, partial [Klebsiella pneumoniae]
MNQRIEEVMLANVKRDVARRKRHFATSVVVLSLLAVAWYVCQIEFQKLGAGLPRLWSFVVQMFPPDLSDLDVILKGAGETLAMATIGTIFATIIAFPLALMAARNTCPNKWTYRVSRAILNASRGT